MPANRDAHDTLARRRDGIGIVAAKFQLAIEYQRAHAPDSNKKAAGSLPHGSMRLII